MPLTPDTPERWGIDFDQEVGWSRYFKTDCLSDRPRKTQIEETLERIRDRQAEREEHWARLVYNQATQTSQRPDEPWNDEFCYYMAQEVRGRSSRTYNTSHAEGYYTAAAVGLYPVRSLTSQRPVGNYVWVATLFPRISGGTVRTADWFQSAGLLFGMVYDGLAKTYDVLVEAFAKLQPIERYILMVMTRHRDLDGQETGGRECWKT